MSNTVTLKKTHDNHTTNQLIITIVLTITFGCFTKLSNKLLPCSDVKLLINTYSNLILADIACISTNQPNYACKLIVNIPANYATIVRTMYRQLTEAQTRRLIRKLTLNNQ